MKRKLDAFDVFFVVGPILCVTTIGTIFIYYESGEEEAIKFIFITIAGITSGLLIVYIMHIVSSIIIYLYRLNINWISFFKKVVISTIAGVISSVITYFIGISEGITLISASVGGLVFVTVSLFGPY